MAAKLSGQVVLLFFCCIQFLTYFDRGLMSGLLTAAQAKWTLDGVQCGKLGSAYFISVMVVAPLVAGALVGASGKSQMYGIAFGSLLWASAAVLCGLAQLYGALLIGRTLTGLGEAFYCVLASPIIDDAAPPGRKSAYLGSFYALVYVATGVGFVAPCFANRWDGGSFIFFVEGALMLPLVLLGVLWSDRFHDALEPQDPLRADEARGIAPELGCRNAVAKTGRVLASPRCMMFFMGYGALIFSLNGWNFWGPPYMEEVLRLKKERGSVILGGVVVVAGLAGSALGGLALDRVVALGAGSAERCRASARVCAASAALSLPFGMAAMAVRSPWTFMAFATVYIFLMTVSTAPCVVGLMEAVDPDCRGIAMGLASFGSHVFGDVLSPLLVGYLKDRYDSLIPGMWVLVLWGIFATFFWGLASLPCSAGSRRRGRGGEGVEVSLAQ